LRETPQVFILMWMLECLKSGDCLITDSESHIWKYIVAWNR
jgi:hypothetical protein